MISEWGITLLFGLFLLSLLSLIRIWEHEHKCLHARQITHGPHASGWMMFVTTAACWCRVHVCLSSLSYNLTPSRSRPSQALWQPASSWAFSFLFLQLRTRGDQAPCSMGRPSGIVSTLHQCHQRNRGGMCLLCRCNLTATPTEGNFSWRSSEMDGG